MKNEAALDSEIELFEVAGRCDETTARRQGSRPVRRGRRPAAAVDGVRRRERPTAPAYRERPELSCQLAAASAPGTASTIAMESRRLATAPGKDIWAPGNRLRDRPRRSSHSRTPVPLAPAMCDKLAQCSAVDLLVQREPAVETQRNTSDAENICVKPSTANGVSMRTGRCDGRGDPTSSPTARRRRRRRPRQRLKSGFDSSA